MQDYIEQRLVNWGNWMRKQDDAGLGYGQSPIASLMSVAARAEPGSAVPVNECDAALTDSAVRGLPRHLQTFAGLWYVRGLTIREVAKRMSCGTATVQVRMEEIRIGVKRWLDARDETIRSAIRSRQTQ